MRKTCSYLTSETVMEHNFFEIISQFFQSILQLEDTAIVSIIIFLVIVIVVLKILSKISKIIQVVLIVGVIVMVSVWFLR